MITRVGEVTERGPTARIRARVGGVGNACLTILPGVMLVVFAFHSGGFFPGITALAGVCLLVALVLRVALARRPFGGLSIPYVIVAFALALLAGWTLRSSAWSDAPARAVVEYDRVLLYLLAFVLGGALARTRQRLRWMIRGIAAAAVVVCVCALITRLLPDVWAVEPDIAVGRLSYPLTYWNALGLVAALGLVLCFAMTCDDRESRAGRVLSAAALPALAVALLLTFSRGSIAVAVLGLLTMVVVGRPRALLSGLLVAVPTTGLALVAGYRADLLAGNNPTSIAAAAQGHDVALAVAVCVGLAALARAALLGVDHVPSALGAKAAGGVSAEARWAVRGGAVIAAIVVAIALSLPSRVHEQYDRFLNGSPVDTTADRRDRLTNPDNNGRILQWRVATDAFHEQPLHGEGAGTYELRWDRERPSPNRIEDAHSLYAEVLGELGVVGFGLLVVALLAILAGFLALARGPDRAIGGALFAAGLAWAVHAGIEWDWELPAVSVWLFAAGGLALARPRRRRKAQPAPAPASRSRLGHPITRVGGRVIVCGACVGLALVPLATYRSEGPLRDGVRAFLADDCPRAVDRALDSIAILDLRPEPYVVLGYCDIRLGHPGLAVAAFRNAIRRDPGNWEMHYGFALARAAKGEDPRGRLRIAQRLNPRETLPAAAYRILNSDDPRDWQRRVGRATVPTR